MDGFERRKEQSKEDIRKAADLLFTKYGADKVSVNDIARQAGVSQATIYNNFGSKDELVHDYRNTIIKAVTGSFRSILVLKKSYAEKLQDMFQSWIDMTDRYNLRAAGGLTADQREPAARAGNQEARQTINQEIENTLLEFIREGKNEGHPGPPVSEEAVALHIKFFQEGLSNHPEIQRKAQGNAKLSEELTLLFRYGINGKENQA
jgi:AcrR family transcriptional regulator